MKLSAKTRQESAFQQMRADILAGRLKPGQKLPFAELGSVYEVSVGSLREALTRLVEQGLVRSAPQVGFFVTPLSKRDLVDLTVARREIEAITLRHAIAEGDTSWESEVLAAHHRLDRTPLTSPEDPRRFSEQWAAVHNDFHATLLQGCSNGRLSAIASQLRASAELYQRWSLSLAHGEERDIPGEHRALLDAVLARNSDLAVEILDKHIALTTEILLASGLAEDEAEEPAARAS